MNPIEKKLYEEGRRRNKITAPISMEKTLLKSLEQTAPHKKRKPNLWMKITIAIAAILILSLTTYNYPALAYYSKKIIGFDGIPNLTLSVLNEQEKGQVIDKSITLNNGTTFTIDGIMTDENQFILFYTLANPDGVNDTFPYMHVSGFLTKANQSHGTGVSNDNGTEFKGIAHFSPINLFAKNLTLKISYEGLEPSKLSFKHNPNKAMTTNFKQKINQSITVDQGELKFLSITATPTTTIISGKSTVKNLEKIESNFENVKLIANGEEVIQTGYSFNTGITGTEFEIKYNALREDTKTLSIMIQDFVGYDVIDQTISLNNLAEQPINLIDQKELLIKDINQTKDTVEIKIATEENILLDGVSIETESGDVILKTTVDENYIKNDNGAMMKERTLIFETKEIPHSLQVTGLHYLKPYFQSIDIPVN